MENQNAQKLPDGWEKWPMVYPQYIDASRTIAEGRKVSKSDACAHPHPMEIAEVCQYFKLPFVVERYKAYSRDSINRIGRVRVKIKDDEGNFINEKICSRRALFRELGRLVPQLKSRIKRVEAAQAAIAASASAKSSKGSGKKSKKKKGKRR